MITTESRLLPDASRLGRTDSDDQHRLWLEQFPSQCDPYETQKMVRQTAVVCCPNFKEIGTYDNQTGRYYFFGFGTVERLTPDAEKVFFRLPAACDSQLG